jgi:hypothetical protein
MNVGEAVDDRLTSRGSANTLVHSPKGRFVLAFQVRVGSEDLRLCDVVGHHADDARHRDA